MMHGGKRVGGFGYIPGHDQHVTNDPRGDRRDGECHECLCDTIRACVVTIVDDHISPVVKYVDGVRAARPKIDVEWEAMATRMGEAACARVEDVPCEVHAPTVDDYDDVDGDRLEDIDDRDLDDLVQRAGDQG